MIPGVSNLSRLVPGLSQAFEEMDAIHAEQQTALDGKASASHSHTIGDTTNLQTTLDGKAVTGHNHAGTYEPANANIQSHIGSTHAPANAQANADITKAEIEAKLTGSISSHSHAGGGGGPTTGTAVVNFGAFPGTTDASIAVTGQTNIVSGSFVDVRKRLVATADHSIDEHFVEEWDVEVGNIVSSVGFTVYARTRNKPLYGQWNVAFSWS